MRSYLIGFYDKGIIDENYVYPFQEHPQTFPSVILHGLFSSPSLDAKYFRQVPKPYKITELRIQSSSLNTARKYYFARGTSLELALNEKENRALSHFSTSYRWMKYSLCFLLLPPYHVSPDIMRFIPLELYANIYPFCLRLLLVITLTEK